MNQTRNIRKVRKRLFIGLISGTCFMVCLFLAALWIVPFIGLENIHPTAKWVLGGLVILLVGCVSVAYWGLFLNIITKKALPGSRRFRGLTIKFFLPVMVLLGKAMGIKIGRASCRERVCLDV